MKKAEPQQNLQSVDDRAKLDGEVKIVINLRVVLKPFQLLRCPGRPLTLVSFFYLFLNVKGLRLATAAIGG